VETRSQFLSTATTLAYNSHRLVFRELRPGALVKIGAYLVSGHADHVFPNTTKVNWRVLQIAALHFRAKLLLFDPDNLLAV